MVKATKKYKNIASEQLYEDVFLNAPLGIYTLDSKGTITSFNPKMAELAGDDPNEVIGLNVFEMDSYKKAGLDVYFAKGLKGEAFDTEVDYVSYLGHKKSTRHYRGVPLKDHGQSNAVKLLLLVEDITEQKKAELRLKRSRRAEQLEQERLLALINSLADGVMALDENHRIVKYNGAALSLLDLNENLTGRRLQDVMHVRDKDDKKLHIEKFIKEVEGPRVFTNWLLQYSDGEKINLYISITPVHLGYRKKGERGHVLLLRDITKEKTVEAQRDEFISVVSHELRTPLAIAEASISTALLPEAQEHPEKSKSLLEEAHQNVVFLSNMVNDITALTLDEQEVINVVVEDVSPAELAQTLAKTYIPKAKKKGLKFHLDLSDDLPVISSNLYRLKEVLNNLLNNAVKYTEKGSITLSVERADANHIRFIVTDTGIGISKSDRQHIFKRFWRSEDYRTRTHSGTGLGLYLTKRLADRLQGKIEFTSRINRGSTFTLTVPLALNKNFGKK